MEVERPDAPEVQTQLRASALVRAVGELKEAVQEGSLQEAASTEAQGSFPCYLCAQRALGSPGASRSLSSGPAGPAAPAALGCQCCCLRIRRPPRRPAWGSGGPQPGVSPGGPSRWQLRPPRRQAPPACARHLPRAGGRGEGSQSVLTGPACGKPTEPGSLTAYRPGSLSICPSLHPPTFRVSIHPSLPLSITRLSVCPSISVAIHQHSH